MDNYLIMGAGGLASEVFNWIHNPVYRTVVGFYADISHRKEIFDFPVFTDLKIAKESITPKNIYFITAVGDPHLKEKFNQKALDAGLEPCYGFLSGGIIYGCYNNLGRNSIICPNAVVTTNVSIGYGCVVHYNCSIGHDTIIDDYSTLLPGACISGNVEIGKYVVVGSNACIREKIKIADDVFIGMGSVVVKDITEAGTYVGNPARRIK